MHTHTHIHTHTTLFTDIAQCMSAWFDPVYRVVFPVGASAAAAVAVWHEQGFVFVDPALPSWQAPLDDHSAITDQALLECGLVQQKNGPCGLLAVVYATTSRFLLFQVFV